MQVPLLDLKAQYNSIREEIRLAIDQVLESQAFILGPEVERFERDIAAYSGASYSVGVSSGTDGLLVAMMALDIKPQDEIITTPFSFFATAGAIVRLGAVPVFVDIDQSTFNINPELIEEVITPKTKAILPVHLFGQCADMTAITSIGSRRGVAIIEDACQSIGAEHKKKRAGSIGLMGVFSFFPSKNLGGFGDGGMVATDDFSLSMKMKILRQHGSSKSYQHKFIGGNFRLDALQAAVLRAKLSHLDSWVAKRRANADYYFKSFSETGLIRKGVIQIPAQSNRADLHVYNQFTIRVRDRDKLRNYLRINGIGTAVYYPVPLHLQECFGDLGYRKGDLPEAEQAAEEVLSIPIYSELTEEQEEYVVHKISAFYKKR